MHRLGAHGDPNRTWSSSLCLCKRQAGVRNKNMANVAAVQLPQCSGAEDYVLTPVLPHVDARTQIITSSSGGYSEDNVLVSRVICTLLPLLLSPLDRGGMSCNLNSDVISSTLSRFRPHVGVNSSAYPCIFRHTFCRCTASIDHLLLLQWSSSSSCAVCVCFPPPHHMTAAILWPYP